MIGYVASFFLGASVALAELISRYRDRPTIIGRAFGTLFYTGLHGAASAGAFWLVHVFGLTFGAEGVAQEPTRVLVSGFAAMALLRTNFLVTRLGDSNVEIGPSAVLFTLLSAADKSVDRQRAAERSTEVADLMSRISFEKAHISLPTMCLALLQNVGPNEQAILAKSVEKLCASDKMTDRQKSLTLGLSLINLGGPAVLAAAVRALGEEIARC